jgi:hypothetical protein
MRTAGTTITGITETEITEMEIVTFAMTTEDMNITETTDIVKERTEETEIMNAHVITVITTAIRK